MHRIGIIQLSDLQFGPKHAFGFPSTFAKKFAHDVRSLAHKHAFIPTYLILSGDISESGHRKEFEDAQKQIVIAAQDLAIDNDAILVVPGNHDVSWPLSRASEESGDPSLKLATFHRFTSELNSRCSPRHDCFPTILDRRHDLAFILVDTCARESHSNYEGWVDLPLLQKTLGRVCKIGFGNK